MSTRANIIIRDQSTTLYFYRHSDGYPESTGEDLKEFCKGYSKNFRADAMQSAGWLIIHGFHTMIADHKAIDAKFSKASLEPLKGYEWKVGYYEPTNGLHGDVEYVYIIDLDSMTLETREANFGIADPAGSLKKTRVLEVYSITKPGIIGKRGAK